MKRFLVFAGSEYYPCGGWEDFVGDYDTVEEAMAADTSGPGPYRWCHVVDTETMERFS